MLLDLPLDIFFIIFYKLDNINHLINIIKTNKYFYNNIDDTYFIQWGINNYTLDFWIKASQRSKNISKPQKTMKLELLRLQTFINTLKIQNITWSNKDFYDFWNMLEEIKNKKNKSNKNYMCYISSIRQ